MWIRYPHNTLESHTTLQKRTENITSVFSQTVWKSNYSIDQRWKCESDTFANCLEANNIIETNWQCEFAVFANRLEARSVIEPHWKYRYAIPIKCRQCYYHSDSLVISRSAFVLTDFPRVSRPSRANNIIKTRKIYVSPTLDVCVTKVSKGPSKLNENLGPTPIQEKHTNTHRYT